MHAITRMNMRRGLLAAGVLAGLLMGQNLLAQAPTPADTQREMDALKKRLDQLEAAQKAAATAGTATPAPPTPAPVDLQTPFAFADFTWMNAVPRNHDSVLDSKYFFARNPHRHQLHLRLLAPDRSHSRRHHRR